jgi:RNA polymerase sigma-70 factor (ECF subfamily)
MSLSFEAAFEAESPQLFRYLRRRVGAIAAEDLSAATFAVVFANWERYDQTRPLRPWLYGIAANLIRHHWRDERRMLRAYARTGVDPVLADDDDVDGRLEAVVSRRELARALADLRPRDREILLLRAWAELSDREIATALALPIGTVKSRLHRIRERLRNRLENGGQTAMDTLSETAQEGR